MTQNAQGVSVLGSLIGFGQVVRNISLAGSTINLGSTTADVLRNTAITVPQDASITAVSGYFSATQNVSIGGIDVITVSLEVWASTTPDDDFTLLTGTHIDLATFVFQLNAGDIGSATTSNLTPIFVSAGTRLILVARISGVDDPPFSAPHTLRGYVSGGITFGEPPI
jgi:BclB C-terminal domain-containing protein